MGGQPLGIGGNCCPIEVQGEAIFGRDVVVDSVATHEASTTRGFRVHCYEAEDCLVAECHGKLTFENARELKDSVRHRISGYKRIVIDLKEVPHVDSSGLGAIAGLYVSARTRGCRLEVANATEQIRRLFSMTNIVSLFEVAGRHHGKTI